MKDLSVTNQELIIQNIITNMEMSTKITDLRGSLVRLFHRGSVLLSKQEDPCSTSYGNER